nr:hypothetical protein [Chryseobacterium koreense]
MVIELESQGLKTESQYPISFGIVSKF